MDVDHIGPHQTVEQLRVAQKGSRQIGARAKQPDQGAQGGRVFAQQGQKAGARPNRGDQIGYAGQRKVRIRGLGHLAEQTRGEFVQNLAPPGGGRRVGRPGVEQHRVLIAVLDITKAELPQQCGGPFPVVQRLKKSPDGLGVGIVGLLLFLGRVEE